MQVAIEAEACRPRTHTGSSIRLTGLLSYLGVPSPAMPACSSTDTGPLGGESSSCERQVDCPAEQVAMGAGWDVILPPSFD